MGNQNITCMYDFYILTTMMMILYIKILPLSIVLATIFFSISLLWPVCHDQVPIKPDWHILLSIPILKQYFNTMNAIPTHLIVELTSRLVNQVEVLMICRQSKFLIQFVVIYPASCMKICKNNPFIRFVLSK